ncbi:hypothetical protein B0A53_02075 [Rhodotorula sp. CCFEE 5036]|nr:hypothetical protein B0A53_02075 [Rhodotorula sp. CCFEE 5036]
MATGVYYDQGRLPPMQQHQQYRQSYQPQPGAMNQRFSNAFMNPPSHNGQPPVEQQRAYRQSSYAPPPPRQQQQQQLQPQPRPPTPPVRYSHQPPQPSRVERPPRQASMLLDPQQQQQQKVQMQQYHYEQQQQRRVQLQPQQQRQTLQPPDDRFFSSASVPMASDLSSSSIATNSVASTSASPQPSDERRSKLPPPPKQPKRPTAPLCGPFDMDDWTITDSTLPSCVSPAVFLLWQTSPLAGRDAFETVFVDAQTRRVAFVAREYVRGADGVLRRGGVEDDETRDLSSSQWHEAGGDEEGSPVERLEWLLLSVPSARERERGSDQLGKVGLVTNENLYLPAGKVVRWKKFYKKSFFADEKEEPTWQGIGGTKYRWVVQPGQASMCHLIDHRTKEVIVTVRERSEKPTQIVISALAQPSLQPVLLTLLHRTFTIAEKARNKDRQAWEDEEVVRW